MRRRIWAAVLFCIAALLLPAIAAGAFSAGENPESEGALGWVGELPDAEPASVPTVEADWDIEAFRILNSATGEVETIPVRDYVRGAVAAELPVSFHPEAMKAQAVASHTWALYNARLHRETPDPELDGADFAADPDNFKGYARKEDFFARYGEDAAAAWEKVTAAADSVLDQVLTYEGEPILAVYHSCSAGTTEAAENVWQASVPYLVPVDSPSDRDAPAAEGTAEFTEEEMRTALTAAFDGLILGENPALWLSPISYTDSGYVLNIKVGNQTVTGKEVRAALDLRSACFSVEYDPESGVFTVRTVGYGHGVGLSQYGAEAMAEDGSTYDEILSHYYTGAVLAALS